MEKKQVKFFATEIKSFDETEMTVDAIVSTKSKDRDGDVILPEAFSKRLKHYKAHPVLISSHSYNSLQNQIGEASKLKITDAGLEVTFKYYAGKGNPEADWAWELAKMGIASYSIGFMGFAFDWINEKDPETKEERTTGRKFTDVELLEISQVLVASNRDALQMSRSLNDAENELAVVAMKAFDSGTLKERENQHEGKSITDFIFGPGANKPTPEPKGIEIDVDALCDEIQKTIREVFKNGNERDSRQSK